MEWEHVTETLTRMEGMVRRIGTARLKPGVTDSCLERIVIRQLK